MPVNNLDINFCLSINFELSNSELDPEIEFNSLVLDFDVSVNCEGCDLNFNP